MAHSQFRAPVEEDAVGLTAIWITDIKAEAGYVYLSDSIKDILGYEPSELLHRSCYLIFHPDEIERIREMHYQTMLHDKVACIMYMRLLSSNGQYVDCAVEFHVVYDLILGSITRASDGPMAILRAATAQEVIEVSPSFAGRFELRKWSTAGQPQRVPRSASNSASPEPRRAVSTSTFIDPHYAAAYDALPPPSPRSFFILDRFSNSSRVVFASNDVLVEPKAVQHQSFYCMIRPRDRAKVRSWIDSAKSWSPIRLNDKTGGGFGYTSFGILKLPEVPRDGELVGTEESECNRPGQAVLPVEGIFTAYSDGLVCVMRRQETLY